MTTYELRISDWSSDVCSSDLDRSRHRFRRTAQRPCRGAPPGQAAARRHARRDPRRRRGRGHLSREGEVTDLLNLRSVSAAYGKGQVLWDVALDIRPGEAATILGRNGVGKTTLMKTIMGQIRSEEHTSELQSLMRISYAVFCLKKK